jgi:hypothetical protein
MNREFLREIEEKHGRMLESWDRTRGMDNAYLFVLPYVPPPEDFVIQGIRRPDPPKVAQAKLVQKPFKKPLKRLDAAKLGECFRYDFLDKLSAKCLLKRLKCEDACIRNAGRSAENLQTLVQIRRPEVPPKAPSELCIFCDFSDKRSGYCLIKRVNGSGSDCPFVRKRNGAEAAP